MNLFNIFKNRKEGSCCYNPDDNQNEEQNLGLGTFLIEKGLIDEAQLSDALEYQKENKTKKIGEVLVDVNLLGEDEVLSQLAAYLNVEYINLERLTFPLKVQQIFNKRVMVEKAFAPYDLSGNIISIAISDINNSKLKQEIQDMISLHTANLNPIYYLSLPKMIRRFIANSYEKHPHERTSILGTKKKFGEYLIERKLINQEQLNKILSYQKEYVHKRFGELLYEMKFLNREDVLKELAAHEGKEFESLQGIEPQNELMIMFELDQMIMNSFVPFEKEGDLIKVAMNNIFDDELIEDITKILNENNLKCKFYISLRDSIRNFIEKEKNKASL